MPIKDHLMADDSANQLELLSLSISQIKGLEFRQILIFFDYCIISLQAPQSTLVL